MLPSERAKLIEDAILKLGGHLVDPWPYAARLDRDGWEKAFGAFLKASGVRHFTAREFLTPSPASQKQARKGGWKNGMQLPEVWTWPVGAILGLVADQLRDAAGGPISCRNWFRCSPVNHAVAKSGDDGDHPHGCAFDLDVSGKADFDAAWDVARRLYESAQGERLQMSLGRYPGSPRTIHLGFMSPLGKRKWGW